MSAPAPLDVIVDALDRAADYFDERADTEDGTDSRPVPNAEMRLGAECRDAIGMIGRLAMSEYERGRKFGEAQGMEKAAKVVVESRTCKAQHSFNPSQCETCFYFESVAAAIREVARG